MSADLPQWAGAKWYRFDFHTHTPASTDYGKGPDQAKLMARTPQDWLLDYMRAEIDCVAVTDHNSGAWIDTLNAALGLLDVERPEGYRPLTLFPGVELSVQGGIHLLAILAPGATTAAVDTLLGAVGYRGSKGESDAVTETSFVGVAEEITRAGGLAIPAHVCDPRGLFNVLAGESLRQAIKSPHIFAMEINGDDPSLPQLYRDEKLKWTSVLGSDAHHPSGEGDLKHPGSHFTWVKMGTPSFEDLKFALLYGRGYVRRSPDSGQKPNDEHARLRIEHIEVSDAKHMGRRGPLQIPLSPWLSTIIGGRGTGKSTLVEFLRFALQCERRDLSDSLKNEFDKYTRVPESGSDGGLLEDNTKISVTYLRGNRRFKVQRRPGGVGLILYQTTGGDWAPAEGEISARFPVSIYSQKQVLDLANQPSALLDIVNNAGDIDFADWEAKRDALERRFLKLRAEAREVIPAPDEAANLRGTLEDVQNRLEEYEKSRHAEILRAFQQGRKQTRLVEQWENTWVDAAENIRALTENLVPDPLQSADFDPSAEAERSLLAQATSSQHALVSIQEALVSLSKRSQEVAANWRETLAKSAWRERVESASSRYKALRERAGDANPTTYADLVQQRQQLETRIAALATERTKAESCEAEAQKVHATLIEHRRSLTKDRVQFFGSVLGENPFVRIKVQPYGEATDAVVREFRELITRAKGFEKDIGEPGGDEGLLSNLPQPGAVPSNMEAGLIKLKTTVRGIAEGTHEAGHKLFKKHLASLQPEVLDRLDLWFPEDALKVRYSPSGDGRGLTSIKNGSPGQKTAALLAFLLSYGKEPLVLDQPEDDLDNRLIYKLLVRQLREIKPHRQVLVVTHNPNIVVNGGAELVTALASRGGQTQIEATGSLGSQEVRETICEIMEGGREAFDRRYRHITMEGT